jgi:hypothetical protein
MRRIVVLLVAGTGAAVAAAALFAGNGESAQGAIRHAAARTLDAGSSRVTISYGDHAGAARGVMDYVQQRGTLRVGRGMELVFDGDVTYSKFSAGNGVIPAGKWLKGERGVGNPFDLQDRALSNPATLLDFLRTGSSEVRSAGRERIDGVQTTRYDGVLDFEKVVELSPLAGRADLRAELSLMRDAADTSLRYSAWVDSDGVTRRLELDHTGASALTIDFYDFGVPVHVSVPRNDKVLSDADLRQIVAAHAPAGNCRDDGGSSIDGWKSGCSQVTIFFSDSDPATATGAQP